MFAFCGQVSNTVTLLIKVLDFLSATKTSFRGLHYFFAFFILSKIACLKTATKFYSFIVVMAQASNLNLETNEER